jgi:hypothetical protein
MIARAAVVCALCALACRAAPDKKAPPAPSARPVIQAAVAPTPPKVEPKPEALLNVGPSAMFPLVGDESARQNVVIGAKKIDGHVVGPRKVFSFNQVVGERTEAAGFKSGKTLFAGEEVEGVGGGICQLSTALYVSLMRAGYRVTERHPHSRPRRYAHYGMDSAVNFPDLDLKFLNDSAEPVEIRVEIKDEDRYVVITLVTKKEVIPVSTLWHPLGDPKPGKVTMASPWVKEPRLHRKGEPGHRGYRVWFYGPPLRIVKVPSTYKALDEIMIVPKDGGADENIDELGGADGDSGVEVSP